MSDLLVIRFGALGDLCVLGWSLARLADEAGDRRPRVTVVTKRIWADLIREFRGVDQVVALGGSGIKGVADVAGTLREMEFDTIIDAHNTLRSHLLLGMMRRRPRARLAKDTAARLAFIGFKWRSEPLERSMRDRFDALFGLSDGAATIAPPLDALGAAVQPQDIIGLAPGAHWPTKQWPDNKFAALTEKMLEDDHIRFRIFLGPRERGWFSASALAAVADTAGPERIEIVAERPLVEVAERLAGCRRLVTNDSGLLHLAEAVGTPVVALFGPTVREFGYFPQLADSRTLEVTLDCRPCSRNGKRPCHRGDLACLDRIGVEAVTGALDHRKEAS